MQINWIKASDVKIKQIQTIRLKLFILIQFVLMNHILLFIVSIIFLILINWFYNDVSSALYFAFPIVWVIFAFTSYLVSQKIIEIFILLKTNKDLIHTIQSILQIFPEGVIIRSIDPVTKQTIIKFANNIANQFFLKIGENLRFSSDLKVSMCDSLNNNFQMSQNIDDFLNQQESNIDINKFDSSTQIVEIKEWYQQIEEIKEFSRSIEDNEEMISEFFNIKSIKVQWENLDSYLHVFINTTQVFLNL